MEHVTQELLNVNVNVGIKPIEHSEFSFSVFFLLPRKFDFFPIFFIGLERSLALSRKSKKR